MYKITTTVILYIMCRIYLFIVSHDHW